MTELSASQFAALEPLRAALLRRARAEADRVRAEAGQEGQALLAAAGGEADALIAGARALGKADAASAIALERARSRTAARGIVLAARRACYSELRQQARTALRGLLEDPDRRARLAAAAGRSLGDRGAVRDDPDGGLVVETHDGRTVDASVDTLVDSALGSLDLEQLWAPT